MNLKVQEAQTNLISNKGGSTNQWGEITIQQMVFSKLVPHVEKNKTH